MAEETVVKRFRPKETGMTARHDDAVAYFAKMGIKGAALTRLMLDLLVEKYKEESF